MIYAVFAYKPNANPLQIITFCQVWIEFCVRLSLPPAPLSSGGMRGGCRSSRRPSLLALHRQRRHPQHEGFTSGCIKSDGVRSAFYHEIKGDHFSHLTCNTAAPGRTLSEVTFRKKKINKMKLDFEILFNAAYFVHVHFTHTFRPVCVWLASVWAVFPNTIVHWKQY